jgi:hypothetical protein
MDKMINIQRRIQKNMMNLHKFESSFQDQRTRWSPLYIDRQSEVVCPVTGLGVIKAKRIMFEFEARNRSLQFGISAPR